MNTEQDDEGGKFPPHLLKRFKLIQQKIVRTLKAANNEAVNKLPEEARESIRKYSKSVIPQISEDTTDDASGIISTRLIKSLGVPVVFKAAYQENILPFFKDKDTWKGLFAPTIGVHTTFERSFLRSGAKDLDFYKGDKVVVLQPHGQGITMYGYYVVEPYDNTKWADDNYAVLLELAGSMSLTPNALEEETIQQIDFSPVFRVPPFKAKVDTSDELDALFNDPEYMNIVRALD